MKSTKFGIKKLLYSFDNNINNDNDKNKSSQNILDNIMIFNNVYMDIKNKNNKDSDNNSLKLK